MEDENGNTTNDDPCEDTNGLEKNQDESTENIVRKIPNVTTNHDRLIRFRSTRPSNHFLQSILQNLRSSSWNGNHHPGIPQNDEHFNDDTHSFDSSVSNVDEEDISDISDISEITISSDPFNNRNPNMATYFVPHDQIIVISSNQVTPSPPNTNSHWIPQATSIIPSWTEKPIFQKYPFVTYGRFVKCMIMLIIICVVVIPVTLQTTNKNILAFATAQPSQISSMTPSMSPIISKWHNDTQINININVEKADIDSLMGYSVSLSSDGNTLAVGGHKTFHVYSYLKQANNSSVWVKVFDLADMEPADNTMGNLSWKTVAALSSDGHNVVVGDALNSDSFQHGGAMMVFTNVDEGGKVVQWYQRGRTIYGNSHWMRSHSYVAIVDDGNRLAVSTNTHADGYAAIYDYDGSEWIEKINIEDNHESRGFMSLSPNGQFFAMGSSLHRLVDIYDLSSNTKLQTLVGVGTIDYGHSMSFSHDGTILAISSWSIGLVDLYRFDPQKLKYSLMTDPITVANVTGLGHSVSVSANGKYIAVGAVSHPSGEYIEFGEFDDYVFWIDRVSERGSVFVFRIGDDDWDEVGKFEHDKSLYDKIGWSVSISGSGDVIAFGGYGTGGEHGDGPNKRGQVGVYRSERVK